MVGFLTQKGRVGESKFWENIDTAWGDFGDWGRVALHQDPHPLAGKASGGPGI